MYFPALYHSDSLGRRCVRGETMNISKLSEDSLTLDSIPGAAGQDSLQTSVLSSLSTWSELCLSEFGKNRNHLVPLNSAQSVQPAAE